MEICDNKNIFFSSLSSCKIFYWVEIADFKTIKKVTYICFIYYFNFIIVFFFYNYILNNIVSWYIIWYITFVIVKFEYLINNNNNNNIIYNDNTSNCIIVLYITFLIVNI